MYFPKPSLARSVHGGRAFHRSFSPSGMSTSLTRGSPSRLTWTHLPLLRVVPREVSTRVLCRLDDAHTPTTEAFESTTVGTTWLRVTLAIGSWRTMLWTFLPASPSRPASVLPFTVCAVLSGRRPSRSKTDPRSTKNGSFREPAKTFPPPGSVLIDVAASADS